MINGKASPPAEGLSRMLGWGRILLVTGAVLLFLTLGLQVAGASRIGAQGLVALLWCGAAATMAGAILTALGAVEQRLIETRVLLLEAIERLGTEAPAETPFRSRPAVRLLSRTFQHRR